MNPITQQSIALEAALKATHPDVFDRKRPKPLAVGIDKQIAAEFPAVPPRVLSSFLKFWTSRWAYHVAVAKPDSERFNLDGSVQRDRPCLERRD